MKNKILTALLSAVIAAGLWLYVVSYVSPNFEVEFKNVPVTLQGEVLLQDRDLMITTTELPTVTLHLEGNRADLNKLNSSNIAIVVDVSRIDDAGTHTLTYTPSYPGNVASGSITVLNRDPDGITLEVERRERKSVPVDVQYIGTLPQDYMADKENKELDYDHVNIVGPKSVIDRIAMARIGVNLEGQMETISQQFQYTLCDEKGEPVDAAMVSTDVESITMTLKIMRVKEIELKLNVIEGGGATVENSTIDLQPKTILISGSDSLLEGIDSLELGTINLAEMLEDETLTFPIKLPEGVTNETGVAEATVDVKFPDLVTKKLTVTDIQAINIPAGLKVDLVTKRLEVTIRGHKDVLDKVKPEDITVTVDFTNEQVGTATVKAVFTITVDGVGAVGVYNVTAKVQET